MWVVPRIRLFLLIRYPPSEAESAPERRDREKKKEKKGTQHPFVRSSSWLRCAVMPGGQVRRASAECTPSLFSVRRKHKYILLFATNAARGEERELTFFLLLRTDTHERVNDNNDEKKKRCNMNRNNCINKTSGIGNERF